MVRLDEGHVVVADRQAELGEHLVGARALQREDGVVVVVVDDLHPGGRLGAEPTHHLGGVGGVRHEQQVLVVVVVDDQVVDDAAGLVVDAQGVLRLAGPDLAEVVAEGVVHVRRGARAGHQGLAQVADVEEPDAAADRGVLGHRADGILQRHGPAAEVRELRSERGMPIVERRLAEVGLAHVPTLAGRDVRSARRVEVGRARSATEPAKSQRRVETRRTYRSVGQVTAARILPR